MARLYYQAAYRVWKPLFTPQVLPLSLTALVFAVGNVLCTADSYWVRDGVQLSLQFMMMGLSARAAARYVRTGEDSVLNSWLCSFSLCVATLSLHLRVFKIFEADIPLVDSLTFGESRPFRVPAEPYSDFTHPAFNGLVWMIIIFAMSKFLACVARRVKFAFECACERVLPEEKVLRYVAALLYMIVDEVTADDVIAVLAVTFERLARFRPDEAELGQIAWIIRLLPAMLADRLRNSSSTRFQVIVRIITRT